MDRDLMLLDFICLRTATTLATWGRLGRRVALRGASFWPVSRTINSAETVLATIPIRNPKTIVSILTFLQSVLRQCSFQGRIGRRQFCRAVYAVLC
jgi:hypothetical protein